MGRSVPTLLQGACAFQRGRQLSQDREVGVQPDALGAADPKREKRPVMLEPAEFALDG